MADCKCCCETFSRVKNQLVKCPICEFETCKGCQKTYLLSIPTEPHCMSCKKEWSDDYMYTNFTKTFIDKDLKKHREIILMDRQKSLLPTSQEYIPAYKYGKWLIDNRNTIEPENYKMERRRWALLSMIPQLEKSLQILSDLEWIEGDHWIKTYICDYYEALKDSGRKYGFSNTVNDKVAIHQRTFRVLENDTYLASDYMKIVAPVQDERKKLYRQYQKINNVYDFINNTYKNYHTRFTKHVLRFAHCEITTSEALQDISHKLANAHVELNELNLLIIPELNTKMSMMRQTPHNFIIEYKDTSTTSVVWKWACPLDACKGFLNDQHTCGVCSKQFCNDCNVEMCDGHVCNDATKKTIQMLKKDSKPCPKCSTVIHKIDGCDQMWCPDCKSAFSWDTGSIQKRIHNPHYYEYLRNTQGFVPREPGDDPVNCDNITNTQIRQLHWVLKDHVRRHPTYMPVWDSLRLVSNEIDHGKWRIPTDKENKEQLWRVQYLINDIDENTWKKNLQQQDKAYRKKIEIHSILTTYVNLCYDIVMDNSKDEFHDFLNEKAERHSTLVNYFNPILANVSRMYKCVVPVIQSNAKKYTNKQPQ